MHLAPPKSDPLGDVAFKKRPPPGLLAAPKMELAPVPAGGGVELPPEPPPNMNRPPSPPGLAYPKTDPLDDAALEKRPPPVLLAGPKMERAPDTAGTGV